MTSAPAENLTVRDTLELDDILKPGRWSARFVRAIPIHFARRHTLLGLNTADESVLEIAAADESTASIVDNLALTLGCEVRLVVAARDEILKAIDYAYQAQDVDVAQTVAEVASPETVEIVSDRDGSDLLDTADCAPVVRLVNQILFEAARRRASDVHVQPLEAGLVVRFRIDGVLIDYLDPPAHLLDELVSRIKVMGGMDIAERRLPQDGRTTVRIGKRLIDLRISAIPTTHGERIVLRLLDKGARLYDLDKLGMADTILTTFSDLVGRSHGLILMTGPTGSGKSTTLYAALQRINYRQLNVLTLEDPIEYHLPGISQSQVNHRKGMTFATGLRSVLRQDPDVIMIGEIRDTETARLAIQSALTGHLVLSTLHTNDAPGAVSRLLDLGIEPYLVADSLLAVGAQRLVRLVCETCADGRAPTVDELSRLDLEPGEPVRAGRGCERCSQTGYYEREGIFELLVVDDAIRERIVQRSSATEIRSAAIRSGMLTLREDGVRKVRAGRTTPAEVLRVTLTQ